MNNVRLGNAFDTKDIVHDVLKEVFLFCDNLRMTRRVICLVELRYVLKPDAGEAGGRGVSRGLDINAVHLAGVSDKRETVHTLLAEHGGNLLRHVDAFAPAEIDFDAGAALLGRRTQHL